MTAKEKVYDWISGDGEQRICKDIDEDQCTSVPSNFLLNAASGFCSKLAEQLVSPGVTLPWLLNMLGASSGFTGLLVPLKNMGSLMPQILISAKIRGFPRRKYFWALPAFFQALMVLLMAAAFWFLDGNSAGYFIVGALFLFSVASGVSSVSFKDVMAKTIPKGRRGRLLATRATGGGVLTLAAGALMFFVLQDTSSKWPFLLLILAGALLWFGAGFFFLLIDEHAGATEGGRNPFDEVKKGWELLKEETNLRNFILARAMLMAIPLAQPFFILYGKNITGAELSGLGLMVIVAGIAGFISSPFWGIFADKSSRKMMMVVAAAGILNILLVMNFNLLPVSIQNIYYFAPLILLSMMLHGGARLSRKTYLTDYAPEEERPLYISLANTFIGIFTIVAAGIGFIAEWFDLQVLFLFLTGMLVCSIGLAFRLKEV